MADITTSKLTISEEDYAEIVSVLGMPVLDASDLPFSQTDFIDLAVFPAYRIYQRFSPIQLVTHMASGIVFSIPFPTEDQAGNPVKIAGIVDVRISPYMAPTAITGNPWADFRMFDNQIMNRYNRTGLPIEKHVSLMQEVESRTWINLRKCGKFRVDYKLQQLIGGTSMVGELEIHWSLQSDNVNDVPFSNKDDVIRLAQANALRLVAMFDSQQQNNTQVNFDGNTFLQRADKLEEEVLARLKGKSKIVLLR